ncbi:hypothetical protein CJF32_00001064 [Rutstroemia sp. NJR-2017a WRK4]|nr:hypothetical protein CJF32_00005048 [Rutstroemia sp. NJR-2017a WRK4]PQE32314.1 hypothetical protein CJF32_00001064 [Rutstroemia sp. NJR-2017a WRK4]
MDTAFSKELSSSPRVEIIEGDAYNSEQLAKLARGLDIIVCCYQGEDQLMTEGQKLLIDACESERVPRYMANDWSLDFTKLEFGQLPQKDPMKHVKAHVDSKNFVKGIHVLNGLFFDTFFSPFFEMYDAKTHTFSHYGNPDVGFEGTSYKNSAQYTARVILDKNAVGIQRFIGDRKTMPEIAKSFEKVYGVKANVVVKGSVRDLHDKMTAVRVKHPNEPHQWLAMFYQYYTVNEQIYVGPYLDNPRYPDVKPVSWEDFMSGIPLEQLPNVYQNPISERHQKEGKRA